VNISFSRSAVDDLKSIKEYYQEQNVPQIGQDFVVTIIEHIETLSTHPDIGRVVPEFDDDSIRELIHLPFRMVYLPESESVNIIRVRRSERLLKLHDN
jgi:plasmid stabilization system protein ParE